MNKITASLLKTEMTKERLERLAEQLNNHIVMLLSANVDEVKKEELQEEKLQIGVEKATEEEIRDAEYFLQEIRKGKIPSVNPKEMESITVQILQSLKEEEVLLRDIKAATEIIQHKPDEIRKLKSFVDTLLQQIYRTLKELHRQESL